MKVDLAHWQGTAKFLEDGIIFFPPYYGVTDGVSGLYLPRDGPKVYDGMTGGQLASRMVSRAFAMAKNESLSSILSRADKLLKKFSTREDMENSGFLPSATFAVCRVTEDKVFILQGADSFAIWEYQSGRVDGTKNQMYQIEKDLTDTIKALMEKHNGDYQKMWEEFRPICAESRKRFVNNEGGYSLINGQSRFKKYANRVRLNRKELKTLILFTDGFVPLGWTERINELADKVIILYRLGGLNRILSMTRQIAELEKGKTHKDFPEATAIAIEF